MRRPVKIRQHDISDCGVACLASIAEYWGLRYSLSKLRILASTSKDGTNLMGLIEASQKIGFIAKGVRCPPENLRRIPLPAIAHIKLKNGLLHFLVLYRIKKKKLVIMDPSDGSIRIIYNKEFLATWTGILILIVPGPDFQAGNHKENTLRRIIRLISPHYSLFIQAFLGAAVYSTLGLSISVYVQKIVDNILPSQNINLLNLLGVIMILILGFRIYLSAIKSLYLLRTGQHIDGTLIMGYYWHLLKIPASFIDTMRTGELISRINDAVKIRSFISNSMIDLIVNILTIIVSVVLACFISLRTAGLLLFFIPLFVLIYGIFNRFNRRNLRNVMEKSADLESRLVESLNNIATIRFLNLEKESFEKTEWTFARFLNEIYVNGRNSMFANNGANLVAGLATIILLWTGSLLVFRQDLTPGQLMLLYSLFGYLLGPLSSLIMMNRTIQDALIAADRLFQILDIEAEKNNSDIRVNLKADLTYDIHFEHVTFGYGNRPEFLKNLSFKINSGQITGIAGESGCGKSTIASLLMRIYQVKAGRIKIGDIDIMNMESASLRRIIGIVPQRIELFSGNFTDNISSFEINADIVKIVQVCKKVGLMDLIDSLPDGLYTKIGERGYSLSGGEIQKIAIARALYREPSILIMDEATSSLDPNSEILIRLLIKSIKEQGKTAIIIAHRLNSLIHCDKIIYLHDCRVAESGTHGELLAQEGYYYKSWNNQFAREFIE